jgi:hypothetical protein
MPLEVGGEDIADSFKARFDRPCDWSFDHGQTCRSVLDVGGSPNEFAASLDGGLGKLAAAG